MQIRTTTHELVETAERICAVCRMELEGRGGETLEKSMAALSTDDKAVPSAVDPAVAKELKWLGLWQAQMDKEKLKWACSESAGETGP